MKEHKAMSRKALLGVVCLLAAMVMGLPVIAAAEKINTDPKQQDK